MREMQLNDSKSSAYNLEEYAVEDSNDELEELIKEPTLKPVSQFELNKEALKPTISSYSEIDLEPTLKSEPKNNPLGPELQINETEEKPFAEEVLGLKLLH